MSQKTQTESPKASSAKGAEALKPAEEAAVTPQLDVLSLDQAIAVMHFLGPKLCEVCGFRFAAKRDMQKAKCTQCLVGSKNETMSLNHRISNLEQKFQDKLEQWVKVFCGPTV